MDAYVSLSHEGLCRAGVANYCGREVVEVEQYYTYVDTASTGGWMRQPFFVNGARSKGSTESSVHRFLE